MKCWTSTNEVVPVHKVQLPVHKVGAELAPLGDRTGDDGSRGGREHELEEPLGVEAVVKVVAEELGCTKERVSTC